MPNELPKKLPSKREVDYKIEWEPRVKAPTISLYRMAPPELKELKIHFKELFKVE